MDSLSELPIDAPDADVVEQTQPAAPDPEESPSAGADQPAEPEPEADEADAAEQSRVVELDEDEYR